MKLLIWGAGAMGGTIGAYLARTGHDVTLVDVAADHVVAINRQGLRLTGPVDSFTVRAPAFTPDALSGTWPAILLCVKAQHTAEATRTLAPHLAADGYVVSIQNGLNELVIAGIVGQARTIGAFVNFGADYLEPGVIHRGNRAAVVLGELDGRITPRLQALHTTLCDFDDRAIVTANIWGYLWGKLAYGAQLFATALTNESIADALALPAYRDLFGVLAREVLAVAAARGVTPEGFNGFDPRAFLPGVDAAVSARSLDEMVAFNRASAKTHSGIWRDLAVHRRRTEVDAQLGPIVALGAEASVPTPLTARLIALIHDIEEGRRPQSLATLDALNAVLCCSISRVTHKGRPMTAYARLQEHIATFNDLLNTINILKWDARTQMPPGGSETRGYQLATLSRLAQAHFSSETTARLLDAAEAEIASEDPDSYRVRAVQQTRQAYEIARRIPADLLSRRATLAPVSEEAWHRAKQTDDFASFAPYLQKMLDLAREQAEAVGYDEHPFDALVFEYEPSMTAAKLRVLFDDLKAGLLPLLKRIVANDRPLPKDLWAQEYPVERQRIFSLEMAVKIGYDMGRGHFGTAPHPFEISFTRQDVRITTRYNPRYLPMALFGTLHEAGHALYEQNVDPALTRTALTTDFHGQYAVGGTSYGAHEASSRLWENQIGRSRQFWNAHFARLSEVFPQQLAGVDAGLFYRAVNRVRPSLIRVEADEVTYNLHIMLRVEVEMALLEGTLVLADLPEFWRAKMGEYLGVVPQTDSEGALQDVHWSGGSFGAFPGYTVGNVMSAQLLEAAHAQVAGLDDALAAGDYAPLLGWLTEHVYRHGRAYTANELLQRSTGRELHTGPYLRYLTEKFSDLYGLQ